MTSDKRTYRVKREDGTEQQLTHDELMNELLALLDRGGMIMWFERGEYVKLTKE